jgi:hypothetical protein
LKRRYDALGEKFAILGVRKGDSIKVTNLTRALQSQQTAI